MNRAHRSAIVLILASAAAAYEQDAYDDPDEVCQVVVDAAMEDVPMPRRLLSALLAWALGRTQRVRTEVDNSAMRATSPTAHDVLPGQTE
jgi:hypothetical protein